MKRVKPNVQTFIIRTLYSNSSSVSYDSRDATGIKGVFPHEQTHHSHVRVSEGEGQHEVRRDGGDDAQYDPRDVAAALVDEDAEERAQRRRQEVHHRVHRVRVLRREVEFTLEKQPANILTK